MIQFQKVDSLWRLLIRPLQAALMRLSFSESKEAEVFLKMCFSKPSRTANGSRSVMDFWWPNYIGRSRQVLEQENRRRVMGTDSQCTKKRRGNKQLSFVLRYIHEILRKYVADSSWGVCQGMQRNPMFCRQHFTKTIRYLYTFCMWSLFYATTKSSHL